MIVVLDSAASIETVLPIIRQVAPRAVLLGEASPPLIALPTAAPEQAEAWAALPGVRRVIAGDAPVLSTFALHDQPYPVDVGPMRFGGRHIPVIAGPCSVDTPERLQRLAQGVKEAGATLLRGGAFKGRTSPYAFQGLGREGVTMLAEVGRATGLPVVTEVISESDVAWMAETVDMLQVGARNMHNTALLKLLGQQPTPVLLKRGFGSTVDELLRAADYVLAGGNSRVILCERGIRSFERGVRFSFDLSAFAKLKRESRLPIVVDPSHAAGDAPLVPTIARAAVAAGADGLLIEVHDAPPEALSDQEQALCPGPFSELMNTLRPIAAAVNRTL